MTCTSHPRAAISVLLAAFVAASAAVAEARTTTYAFSTPPDTVFVRTTPTNSGTNNWPAQILDGEQGSEEVEGVVFENEINNTVFFDDNALLVSNSSLMVGNFGWGDARFNGADRAFFTFNFANRVGGAPRNVSFDFAAAFVIPSLPARIVDTSGNVATVSSSPSGTYTHGQGMGSHGRVVLATPPTLLNIARIELELPVATFGTFQLGVDNLTFNSGPGANFNGMGNVNGADLAVWRNSFGQNDDADADGDGDADGADFLLWQRQFGTSGAETAAAVPIPEPRAAALLTIAAVCASQRRRPAAFRCD